MIRANTLIRMEKTGAMAIVRTKTLTRGYEIADGLLAGGIDVMEVSYTNPNAGKVIAALKDKYGDRLIVGAGTVLDGETARLAILKGAEFIIAPNFSERVASICNLYQVPYCPGCTSHSEVVEALEAGASFIKAFPIANFYGPDLVKVFKTPMPYVPLLASGGITLENLAQWVHAGTEICAFGGLLSQGTPQEITANAKEIRAIITEARIQAGQEISE